MDIRALVIQMVGVQKATVDNGFEALATIQDEMERIANDFMDQAGWIPTVTKGYMREWFGLVKKSRDDLKKVINDGFDQVGGYIGTTLQRSFIL